MVKNYIGIYIKPNMLHKTMRAKLEIVYNPNILYKALYKCNECILQARACELLTRTNKFVI